MDHQTFAAILGNYGEFFGAIAVVVTLIYLAGQLRQNTNALRSASYSHWNEVSSTWSHFYAQHAVELAEIEEHASIDQLTSAQQKVLDAAALIGTNQAETAFLQHRAGTLDQDVFDSRITAYTNFVAERGVFREAWLFAARNYTVPEFVAFIEARLTGLEGDSAIA